ncbi:AAA domain-containing protein [Sarocladium implicatum]|nr:AAA domain-containing protein [Sarocladium implicatum]
MPPTSDPAILSSLNKAQRRAVTSNASTVAILAGPGSGKTHTLTSRVVWLVQQANFQPSDIIVATFTVKAAREMRERIGKTLGEHVEKKIILGTFHSIARRYLAAYGKQIGLDLKFGIADDGDSKAIIQRIVKRLDLNIEPSYAKSWISKQKASGTGILLTQKSQKKTENPALSQCFQAYQDQLARSNLLDYDDLLVKCVELMRAHPSCVSNIQSVLIDEYQDTNGIQYELMRLFAQSRQRITIVGDPDQSIYGWRSAEIKNLHRLLRDYPQTDEVSLEENYRSSQSILNVSLQVIQQDQKRYKKVLLPVHTKGATPVLRTLKSSAAEGEWIVTEIKRMVMMLGNMVNYDDVAILLRSAALSRHIESALGKAGVTYRMIGGHKFYDRKEIKILLDYLRVVFQPDNNDAVARVINVPRRGIGDTTIKALLEEAEKAKISLWTVLCKHCRGERKATTNIRTNMEQKLNSGLLRVILTLQQKASSITESSQYTLVDLIEQLATLLGFKKFLEDEYPDDHEGRWANVQELFSLARDFTRDLNKDEDDALPDIQDLEQEKEEGILGRFLANIALASDAQKGGDSSEKSSVVTISTIHAAKGLEWPVVFVPSVYTGSIPHSRSEDMDEERRLLYVAMTRAKALLYLSCPLYGSQGMSGKVELSPFIAPIATTAFAQKGPSFDRAVVEGAAKILGREAPTEKRIFGTLPTMFSPEDDRFPIDPADPKTFDGIAGSASSRQPSRKRQRGEYSDGTPIPEERPWKREYSTTMEQASDFTISSLPGFTTAGAHQTALAAADAKAAAAAAAAKPAQRQGAGRGGAPRGTGQRSLLNYVATTSMSEINTRRHEERARLSTFQPPPKISPSSSAAREAAVATVAQHTTAIAPALAKHRVATGRPIPLPSSRALENAGPRKQYACFSSSPPRPSSPEKPAAAEPGNSKGDESINVIKIGGAIQPATTFHATTFQSVKDNGGVRRPVGLGPPPTMDRLRKPFKPLTINRPQRKG